MDAATFVCHFELVTAGSEASREAEMENVMGAAIFMWSLSFSTLVKFPDCTLHNKTFTQKLHRLKA